LGVGEGKPHAERGGTRKAGGDPRGAWGYPGGRRAGTPAPPGCPPNQDARPTEICTTD